MVGGIKVGHQEADVLLAEHVNGAVLYQKCDLPQGLARLVCDYSPEWTVDGCEVLLGEAELAYCAREEEVEGAPLSMSTLVKCTDPMVVSSTRGKCPV
jgi:hypothetical protein